jgi:cadmium resistance protein CadD (predicted permease)
MITSTTYKNFGTLLNYRINQTNFVNIVVIYGNTNISNTIKARIKFFQKRAICSKTTIIVTRTVASARIITISAPFALSEDPLEELSTKGNNNGA